MPIDQFRDMGQEDGWTGPLTLTLTCANGETFKADGVFIAAYSQEPMYGRSSMTEPDKIEHRVRWDVALRGWTVVKEKG